MFGKLLKHEFRATGRIGLPLCGIMIVLSVVAGMALRFWGASQKYGWWERAGSMVIVLYGMSVFAVAIGIFIVLMQHYKRNLLGDEGYLMRTLPVSIHELLLSKLVVALLWYVASMVLIGLSFLFVGAFSGALKAEYFSDVRIWDALRRFLAELDPVFVIKLLLGYLGGMALCTLLFYADFTLSQTFSKYKLLYNVMGVVIFILLLRLIFAINGALSTGIQSGLNVGVIGGPDGPTQFYVNHGPGGISAWIGLIELYVSSAALYFLTWAFLKYRPNLE